MSDLPPENTDGAPDRVSGRISGHSPAWLAILVAVLVLVGALMLSTHAGEDRPGDQVYSAAGPPPGGPAPANPAAPPRPAGVSGRTAG